MKSRQNEILDLLKSGNKTVKQISETLYIGEMTVRREIKILEEEGLVVKYRGTVMLNPREEDVSYDIRQNLSRGEKMELAKKAVAYLKKDQVIFIDGSTTCTNLLPELVRMKPACVVTNSLKLALDIAKLGIKIKMAPGEVSSFERGVFGCDAIKYISGFNFDVSFLSAKGIDSDNITDDNDAQTHIRQTVVENSRQSVFIMDSTKHNKIYPYTVCARNDVIVITGEILGKK